MALTVEQLKNRHKHLGASDLPAIMGHSRFMTAFDIWLLKTERVAPDLTEKKYQTAGKILEPAILKWAEEQVGLDLMREGGEYSIPGLNMVVHPDAVVNYPDEPVEAKSEGVDHPIIEPWGDAGSDEVPEHVCIQGHCQMMALNAGICHVPTFLGGRGFGYFYIERDDKIVEMIREAALTFWHEYVLKDTPPPDSEVSLALIKRIRRVTGDPVKVCDGPVEQWLRLKETATQAKKNADAAQATVRAIMDGNELGKCGLGDLTDFSQNRKGYTVEPTSYRVLRLKKPKAKK